MKNIKKCWGEIKIMNMLILTALIFSLNLNKVFGYPPLCKKVGMG